MDSACDSLETRIRTFDCWAIDPPGHGWTKGNAYTDFKSVARLYYEELRPHFRGRYSLFGHSQYLKNKSDHELMDILAKYGGFRESIQQNPDFLAHIARPVQADVNVFLSSEIELLPTTCMCNRTNVHRAGMLGFFVADSGGHTDNQPAMLLFQNMVNLRNQFMIQYGYRHCRIRIGAAGGICTPLTAYAAFCC